MTKILPLPLFDTLSHLEKESDFSYLTNDYSLEDIHHAIAFLVSYKNSSGTFNSYRREIERLLHWSTLVAKKTLKHLHRTDMEAFIDFCQAPPKSWIGTKKPPRFIEQEGARMPNPTWRPFVATVSKQAFKEGKTPSSENFILSHGALRESFAILSSFFNYLLQEDYVDTNPVALIRQKSKFIRKHQGQQKIRRLSELQWQYVIRTAHRLAEMDPATHERTLFIMSALYAMYLRISELAASNRWTPRMLDFARDNDGNWWFTTVGKGNKLRQIAVSDTLLTALKRWRAYLGISALPSPADQSPLLPKSRGQGPMQSTNHIRKIVQFCFDKAVHQLQQDGLGEEAQTLTEATVHWLRHTGISDDVKIRPREHVRDDAGHSSSAITDRYVDIELRERHQSAKKKQIF